MIFNFIQSVIRTRDKPEVVRWNHDNTIAHDPLCMRVANPTEPNQTLRNPTQQNQLGSGASGVEHFFIF
jgi:hypothetical protein